MKYALTALLLTLATHAHAMHAYGDDNCVAMTPEGMQLRIELSNTGPLDPHRISTADLQGVNDDLWVNFGSADLGVDEPVKTAALALKVTKKDITITHGKTDDGCFVGTQSTTVRAATVIKATKQVRDLFMLKVGDQLVFSCYISEQEPGGKHCGE